MIFESNLFLKKKRIFSSFLDVQGRISSLKTLIFLIALVVFVQFVFAQTDTERQASPKGQTPLKVAIFPVNIYSPENLAYIQEGLLDMLSSRVELRPGGGLRKGGCQKGFGPVLR